MKFTESHEWVVLDGEIATVGISDYAQKELGDIVYVELPHVGSRVHALDEIAVLESTKSAIDIYSPLSGEVVEVNTALLESPEKINKSAEKEGWLYRIRLSHHSEYEFLMEEPAYHLYTEN